MEAVAIGYLAKGPADLAEAQTFLGPVSDIASVSECIVSGPDDWHQQWIHNDFWRFDSEQLALSVVPVDRRAEFDVYAYEVLPVVFVDGEQRPLPMPALKVEMPAAGYDALGFDVVVLTNMGGQITERPSYEFGCSPLTCNSLLKEVPVNSHCLLDSAEEAIHLAKRFSASRGKDAEPGNYAVVRVLRKRR